MKKIILSLSLLLTSLASFAGNGIYQSYAIINGAYYDLGAMTSNPDFLGYNFGTLIGGSSMTIGGEIKTFKFGTDNICGGFLTYSMYLASGLPSSGTPIPLGFIADNVDGTPSNQQWGITPMTPAVTVMLPTAPGVYSFAIGVSTFGSAVNPSGCETNPLSTVGPFIATFTIMAPLPVRLSSITGKAIGNSNAVNWQSESEVNVDRYEVQKSRDNKTWATIETLSAKGDASRSATYNMMDVATFQHTNYRLKMIDKDGRFEYSKTIIVMNDGKKKISIYPNPIVNTLTINNLEDVNTIQIFDVKGTKIMDQNIGDGVISFENMPAGLYFVSLMNESGTILLNQKIMKN